MDGSVVRPEGLGPAPSPPLPLDRRARRRATTLMIAVRAGYAYNWFTIGPALPAIGLAYGVGPVEWGYLVGAFLVAAGLLQVPAGMLSRRWGSRRTALTGAALLGLASLASPLAPSFDGLLLLRAAAGAGAALFFSPAIGLVGSLYAEGERGLPVGTFSSAFSAGAAAGIVVSALVVATLGWSVDLAVGGAGLLALTAAAWLGIPPAAGARPSRPSGARGPWGASVPRALRLRSIWAIGLAFVGLEGASFATGQFIVPYGTTTLGWSAALAGGVGMAFVFPSVFGGPVGGVVAERRTNRRTQLAAATAIGAGTLFALPWAGAAGAAAIGTAFSFGYGFVYAVMYVLPAYLPGLPDDEIPIGIGLFNAIQLAGGAAVSAAFGAWVGLYGYPIAWVLLAAAAIVPLGALALVPRTGRRNGLGPSRTSGRSDSPDSAAGSAGTGSARAGRAGG
ncbi:MAG: MFS transporter [Thermoplasmata archaeon]